MSPDSTDIANRCVKFYNAVDVQDLHAKDHTAQPCTEDYFDCAPAFSSKDIQITREGDTWQKVGEENVYSRGYDNVIEYFPV